MDTWIDDLRREYRKATTPNPWVSAGLFFGSAALCLLCALPLIFS